MSYQELIKVIFGEDRLWYWRGYKIRHADQPLFLTHTPCGFPAGSVADGHLVTRVELVAPTALSAGGVAPCWQVYGIKTQN